MLLLVHAGLRAVGPGGLVQSAVPVAAHDVGGAVGVDCLEGFGGVEGEGGGACADDGA